MRPLTSLRSVIPLGFALSWSMIFSFVPVQAQSSALPWLTNLHAERTVLDTVHTIRTRAEVTVSDGLTYVAETLLHDPQRAIFRLTYPDRTLTLGVEGRYIWTYDGTQETEASAFTEQVVLGHQVHAHLLFFDRLYSDYSAPQPATFAGEPSLYVSSRSPDRSTKLYYTQAGHPQGLEFVYDTRPPIVFSFSDWQPVEGIRLPFAVSIDDGERQFQYRYTDVRFNTGALANFRAPEAVLTDEQHLLRLHRASMDAHFFEEASVLHHVRADSVLIVTEGTVQRMAGTTMDATMERIMASREHVVYDDLIRPIVKVSADGTLGWVTAQVLVRGVRLDEDGQPTGPLAFVSAWISLFEKIDGQWRFVGNVSNFQPE